MTIKVLRSIFWDNKPRKIGEKIQYKKVNLATKLQIARGTFEVVKSSRV